jgi:hypothetical protein
MTGRDAAKDGPQIAGFRFMVGYLADWIVNHLRGVEQLASDWLRPYNQL